MAKPLPTAALVVVAAAGLVAASELAAQEAGSAAATVGGVVTAEDGETPLEGVRVELMELERAALTDEFGRYRFTAVPFGSHTLRFTFIGRSVLERTVRVDESSGDRSLDVSLGAAPVALDPLLVLLDRTRMSGRAGAGDVPGSVHVVTERSLEARAVPYDDVHAILREVPGVNVQQEEGYGLRPNIGLRGTGVERSSKITLMEDGVLIAPAPYAAPSAYYFPVAGRMEAVEVRKGSSQIRYGPSTIGGALNMVSAGIPGSFSLDADAATGTDASRKLHVRAGDTMGRLGWSFESYRLRTDGFKRLDGGGPTGFDVEDHVGKVRVGTGLDAPVYQELELKLGYYDQRSDETYLGLTAADFDATPFRRYAASQEDVMRADHRQVQLRHFLRHSSGVDLVTTAYRNTFARNWYKLGSVAGVSIADVLDDPTDHAAELEVLRGGDSGDDALVARANNREYDSRGIQSALGLEYEGLGAHELEIGVRYHEDEEDRFQHEDAYAMRAGEMVLTTAGAPGSQANRVSGAAAWSFYASDRLRIGDLTLTPGLRYESIDFVRTEYATSDGERAAPTGVRENAVSAWIPGLGASWSARPGVRLFAGVHRGFGPPGPGADSETRPESSVNWELGGRVARGGLVAQAAAFYSDYENILGAATLSSGTDGTGDLFNGGEVSVVGLELSAAHDPLAAADAGSP
ncbi:MAG: TonB-dependent receptor domain-containing protein, partial [Gemmatimonadota bacterium]